jgi:hypothetical protein
MTQLNSPVTLDPEHRFHWGINMHKSSHVGRRTLDDSVMALMGPEAINTRVTRDCGGAEKQACDTVKSPTIGDHIVK